MKKTPDFSTTDHRPKSRAGAPTSKQWRHRASGLLLLLPAIALIIVIYTTALLVFFRYSFYSFVDGKLTQSLQLGAYRDFFTSSFYWVNISTTFKLAIEVTLLTFVIGYPVAYAIARFRSDSVRLWVSLAVFSPLAISVVVRSYGWLILLNKQGLLNYLLQHWGGVSEPVPLIYNYRGVVISMTHVLLPFMVFPILSVMTQFDSTLKEAAKDLGANRLQVFWRVTFPLTIQGGLAGAQIVLPLVLSAFVTPALLGGGRVLVLATLIYQKMIDVNWPIAAVAGLTLLVFTIALTTILKRLIEVLFWGNSRGAIL